VVAAATAHVHAAAFATDGHIPPAFVFAAAIAQGLDIVEIGRRRTDEREEGGGGSGARRRWRVGWGNAGRLGRVGSGRGDRQRVSRKGQRPGPFLEEHRLCTGLSRSNAAAAV
jgi:hypothetical protein